MHCNLPVSVLGMTGIISHAKHIYKVVSFTCLRCTPLAEAGGLLSSDVLGCGCWLAVRRGWVLVKAGQLV